MVSTAPKPASEIELEWPLDDPRLTPLIRRLATEYWEIVQRHAEETGFPIVRAWVDVDVDMEAVVWFPLTVHSDTSRAEAWDFQSNIISLDVRRWIDQLEPEARAVRFLVALGVVGVDEHREQLSDA